MLRILKDADVLITNVRPGALKRARLDYESLKDVLPRLIYVSVTGYGLEGEGADLPAFDQAAYWSRWWRRGAALDAAKGTSRRCAVRRWATPRAPWPPCQPPSPLCSSGR